MAAKAAEVVEETRGSRLLALLSPIHPQALQQIANEASVDPAKIDEVASLFDFDERPDHWDTS